MSKRVLGVISLYVFSLVIITADAFLAMLMIVHVPSQYAVMAAMAVFAEGVYFFVRELVEAGHIRPAMLTDFLFTAKSDVVFAVQAFWCNTLNKLYNPLGLFTTWTYYHDYIEELSDRTVALEAQAIQDRLLLASLLSERFGWKVDWFEGGVCFSVKIPDEPLQTYPQTLEHIDKVLADIRFLQGLPLPEQSENEVQ